MGRLISVDDLPEVAKKAVIARNAGERFVDFQIEPAGRVLTRYVNLWPGVAGEIIGRTYAEGDKLAPGEPAARYVATVHVRAACADVIEAYRRSRVAESFQSTNTAMMP